MKFCCVLRGGSGHVQSSRPFRCAGGACLPRGGRRGPLMAPPHARSRGRVLLVAALVAAWLAVVVAVWWRAPAPARPVAPAPDVQGGLPRSPGTGH